MTKREGLAMTRRGFAAALASVPAVGLAGPAVGDDRTERFRSLSARLTGFPEDAIDPDLARSLIDGLDATGDGAGVDRLLSGTGDDDELARRIAVAWYSGVHPTAEGPAARAFHDALVWPALGFAKPPGLCSAEPADWSESPAGAGAAP